MVTDELWMCVHAQSLSHVKTLCDPMDCSPPGSSVHGIIQARILEWVDSSSRDLPDPGVKSVSLAYAGFSKCHLYLMSFPYSSDGKESACNAGDLSLTLVQKKGATEDETVGWYH